MLLFTCSTTERAMAKAKQPAGRKATSRGRARQRKQSAPAFEVSLRPEHQRELFAMALIALALLTVVFYATGITGEVGTPWVDFTRYALGWGALLVPLALGLLGVAILVQERFEGSPLTGATVIGTVLVLVALLTLLEFGLGPRAGFTDKIGEGGGVAGYAMLSLLTQAIGRPAAFVLICIVGLAGVMLTFDITLHELIHGTRDSLARFWATIWSVSYERRAAPEHQEKRPPLRLPEAPPYVPPPGASPEALVPTPIAERPTRASLFKRGEVQSKAEASRPEPKQEARPPQPEPKKDAGTVLSDLLATPTTTPAVPAAEVVQTPLDGFEVQAVQRAWPLPSYELLESYVEGSITDDERRYKSRLIEETLASFKVEAQVVGVNTGPAVTQFELEPAVGVKVNKITSLEKDLMLALAAASLRIEAPIPGKKYVGIEIPNSAISTVGLREVMESDEFEGAKGRLKICLGKDVSGMPVIAGLERMPHLLMAGATGSGKSAGINSIICALLLKHTPDDLKLIMVDPKMVELIVYNQIPHMLSPVVTELERVVPTLKWATREMERRYKVFAKYGFRNIDSYKQAARRRTDLEPMPYIVIIIDELADLMMMAPDEVETLICRLAQMARATGIHLIIATQRPSVDVVTGLIKANFPSRIAFAVTSQIDSRVILDMNGAEQLLGRGDMLYMAADASRPVRVQGTWVSDPEVERLVTFWHKATPPETESKRPGEGGRGGDKETRRQGDKESGGVEAQHPHPASLQGPAEFLSVDEQEELLPEAIKLVQHHKRASASLLQRRLRIGYSKAAQLIDLLEQQGFVGPQEDGRSREVLAFIRFQLPAHTLCETTPPHGSHPRSPRLRHQLCA
jgi:S-DNA-T family DNA segregation ATPase FtsK/SpoIIIE